MYQTCTQVDKTNEFVHAPLNISFLKTLVTNLSLFRNILTSATESEPFVSVSTEISCSPEKIGHVLVCSMNQDIILISFVNWFEIFQATFESITFMIKKEKNSHD